MQVTVGGQSGQLSVVGHVGQVVTVGGHVPSVG